MSGKRWVRIKTYGEELCLMGNLGALPKPFQPGDEVIVMPAADADEMLQTLHNIRTSLRHHWAINIPGLDALLARLSPEGDGAGKCEECAGARFIYRRNAYQSLYLLPCPSCRRTPPGDGKEGERRG